MFNSKITPILAATALVVAVFGQTALGQAAGRLVLPKKSVGAVQLKKNAVTSQKVKNGSLLAADFKAGQLRAGPQGPKGDPGSQGIQGLKGEPGPPGPYPGVLPSGKSVRGAYAITDHAAGAGNAESSSISFGFQLSSPPTPHYIPVGGPANTNCPGTAAAPEARPGHLCVYEGYRERILNWGFVDPLNWYGGTLRPYGIVIWVTASSGGFFMVSGSWAVTAP